MSTYTHGHAEAVLRSHRWRTAANSAAYLLPHLHDGQRLLDVGSGPGTITADLARLVREVVALEVDDDAAALTRAELDRQGVTNATVVVGDVHALDVDALGGAFDVVHAHQVLQHVADPVRALREMLRVTRPGGIVAARDSDYGHFSWHPASAGLDRWLELYDAAARANGGEPHAGRLLLAWAHAAGAARGGRELGDVVLRDARGPRVVGRPVGRPAHLDRPRPPARRRGPRHDGRARGRGGRLAGVGRASRRLVLGPARRGRHHGLTTSRPEIRVA